MKALTPRSGRLVSTTTSESLVPSDRMSQSSTHSARKALETVPLTVLNNQREAYHV